MGEVLISQQEAQNTARYKKPEQSTRKLLWLSDVQSLGKNYERIYREEGTRRLTEVIAMAYFHEINSPDSSLPAQLTTGSSVVQRIAQNAELSEVFLKTIQYMKDRKQILNAWRAANTPKEKEEVVRVWREVKSSTMRYYRKFEDLDKTEPIVEGKEQNSPPHFCVEAVNCSILSAPVPQEHVRGCTICSKH